MSDQSLGKHGVISDKPKKKKGFLFWASLVVMLVATIALALIGLGYLEGCMMYRGVSDDVFDENNLTVDWDKLLAINPETVGWVYIPHTNVSYPVVHTTNNEKYLKTNFYDYNSYVAWGAIFADCNNRHDLMDQNVVTYGHNMNDGSMYSFFTKMADSNVFNANRTIYFLTPAGNYKLRTFSLVHVAATEKIIQVNFGSDSNRINYINDKINRKIVSVEGDTPDPAAMTKIFTFSTCDNAVNTYRYICFAYVEESTVEGVKGVNQ